VKRPIATPIAALLALALLAACADGGGGDRALNLETLRATAPEGTYEATKLENAYVGPIEDDLFIGVSLTDDEATVYVCDGETVMTWLTGAFDAGEVMQFGGFEDGAYVKFGVQDGLVSGAVSVPGRPSPLAFEARPATGDAGLFRAEESFDGVDHVGGWIVLEDGRQRGGTCIPIFCCSTHFCTPCGCVPLPR